MNNPDVTFASARRAVTGTIGSPTTIPVSGPSAARARFSRRGGAVGRVCLILLLLFLSGCGEVEWFPTYQRLPTTPDEFSFTAKSGVEKSSQITSDAVTVSGLTAQSSPVSVTGSVGSNSKYSVNNGTATDVAGTVKNGDTVTVTHTSANALGTSAESTLSLGVVSAKFVSTTRFLERPVFSSPIQVGVVTGGALMQASATIISLDGAVGTHVISIKDSIDSGRAVYSVSDDFEPGVFTSATQTIPVLNTLIIFVRGLAPTASAPVTTTLTIDGLDTVVDLTPP